ncbi:MAG: hypothetical protein GY749_01390 [Desulfobacteraceae bacterium]|nr:hypothetical protein [Desulfobacteraceae bacterium]
MENGSGYIQLAASAIRIFDDDGTVNKDELCITFSTARWNTDKLTMMMKKKYCGIFLKRFLQVFR